MQLNYTYKDKEFNGDLIHPDVASHILSACLFITNSAFNLAHWVFAFSYLELSYRLELVAKKLPQNYHDRRLNTINAIVCLINVTIPATVWVFYGKEDYKAAAITYDVE